MKSIITLWLLRYGMYDMLTDIGDGIREAAGEQKITELGKKQYSEVAGEIYRLRNKLPR